MSNRQLTIDNTCHAGREAICHPELVEGSNLTIQPINQSTNQQFNQNDT